MTGFQRKIINLIQASISGKKISEDVELTDEELYGFLKQQQIMPLVCYGCEKGTRILNRDNIFLKDIYKMILFSEEQTREIERLRQCFESNALKHMALKGSVLKILYPKPEMRLMGDIDILIEESRLDDIALLMRRQGYEKAFESDHESAWRKGRVLVELHKRLIPSYNEDFFDYYADAWERATLAEGKQYEYAMSDEDLLIYLFTHFAKHYRDAGVGIKYVIDFYVLMDSKPDLDLLYVEQELERMKLGVFWTNVLKVLNVWFDGGKDSDITDLITDKVFSNGVWGTKEKHEVSRHVRIREKSTMKFLKFKRLWRFFFPPFEDMRNKYAFLDKCPIALPVMWGVRIIAACISRKSRHALKLALQVKNNEVEIYRDELKRVGLSF